MDAIPVPVSDKRSFRETTGFGSGGTTSPTRVFLSKGDAVRKFLGMLVEWWKRRYPHEVRQYMVETKLLRETLRNGTGMSADGAIAQIGALPSRPFSLAEQLFPGFWLDGSAAREWFRLFPEFNPRTKKLGHFQVGAK